MKMKKDLSYINLGLIDYKEAWDRQQDLFDRIVERKLNGGNACDTLILCEHPHVYTLGKSGHSANLLITDDFLSSIGASYYKIDRGGDITYHGPGQIVGYPLIDLEKFGVSLKDYIRLVEDVIIQTIAHFGLVGDRLDGATGVWLDPLTQGKARKICAIGVKASRFITMHGFALNVNTNMDYFSYINPCGFVDKGVTSLEKELGTSLNMDEVRSVIVEKFLKVFDATLNKNLEAK